MATLITDKIYDGTEVKFLLEILTSGFDMNEDDFEVILTRGNKRMTLGKADLLCDDDYWYVAFDTGFFGPGTVNCIVKAYVPDDDFDDGLRTEVIKFDLLTILRVE